MTDEEIRQAFDEAMSSIPHVHQVAIARYVVSLKDRAEHAGSSVPVYCFRVHGPEGAAGTTGTLSEVQQFEASGFRVSDVYQVHPMGAPNV